jgi:hypothetical protein
MMGDGFACLPLGSEGGPAFSGALTAALGAGAAGAFFKEELGLAFFGLDLVLAMGCWGERALGF